jgi:hypothetical protein
MTPADAFGEFQLERVAQASQIAVSPDLAADDGQGVPGETCAGGKADSDEDQGLHRAR